MAECATKKKGLRGIEKDYLKIDVNNGGPWCTVTTGVTAIWGLGINWRKYKYSNVVMGVHQQHAGSQWEEAPPNS